MFLIEFTLVYCIIFSVIINEKEMKCLHFHISWRMTASQQTDILGQHIDRPDIFTY